jgi:hypothetical protein
MNGLNGLKMPFLKGILNIYEYKHFKDIQEIDTGGFGKVYRAKWKNSY